MGRGPHYEGPIIAEMQRLADTTAWPASDILTALQDLFGDKVAILNVRTVARWIKTRRGAPGEAWTPAAADPDEVAAVIEVLAAIREKSRGEIFTVSRLEAAWISRIRRTVPHMPPLACWGFAKDYIAVGEGATVHLDQSLGFALAVKAGLRGGFHLDRERIAEHVDIHVRQWLSKPLVFWAGSEAGGAAYVEEMGRHASLIKRGDYHGYLMRAAEWSWYDSDGFGRLIIDVGKGALE